MSDMRDFRALPGVGSWMEENFHMVDISKFGEAWALLFKRDILFARTPGIPQEPHHSHHIRS